jgi:hypothetical protein
MPAESFLRIWFLYGAWAANVRAASDRGGTVVAQFTSSTFGKYTGWWLVGTAIFELLLAGVFFFIGGSGMVLTGVILGVVGVILLLFGIGSLRKASASQRIDETGLAGTGQVVGLTQTGMYLNNNPQIGMQLMVSVPGRNPYQVEVRQFVPLMLLGSIQVGSTLPVKVDQQNPSKVVIDWDAGVQPNAAFVSQYAGMPGMQPMGAMPGMVPAAMPGSMPASAATVSAGQGSADQLHAQLAANGLDGTATINTAQDTGVAVGANKLFSIVMTVNVPGKAPYQETSATMVPPDDTAKLVAGVTVPVKVSPDNPNLVMIEWDKV